MYMRRGRRNNTNKVLLVNTPIPSYNYLVHRELSPHGGLLTLGSILSRGGIYVELIHMVADGYSWETIAGKIKQERPNVVGITVLTSQAKMARKLTEITRKESPSTKIIIGGPHVTAIGEDAKERFPLADTIVVGEADTVIEDICRGKREGLIRTPTFKDLDSLPFYNLDLVSLESFTNEDPPGPRPSIGFTASRGCPFNCSFCSKPVTGNLVRTNSPEYVVEHLDWLIRNWGIREVIFQDDTFNVNLKWTFSILEGIIRKGLNKKTKFRVKMRANERLTPPELFPLMKKAGFWFVFYGVESGNQELLDKSIGKDLTVEEIKRAFDLCHKVGIKTEASFIIGMPGETHATIMDSVNLWKVLKPHWGAFSPAVPYPGTEMTKTLRAKGHLLVEDLEDIQLGRILVRTDELTEEDLEKYSTWVNKMVTRRKLLFILESPRRIMSVLKDTGSPIDIVKKIWSLSR